MSDSTELVGPIILPVTGEIIDRADPVACGNALVELRNHKAMIQAAERELADAIIEQSTRLGTKTVRLGRGKAIIKGGRETVYDPEKLEAGLRRAGMPEDRIREIVLETVTYRVAAVEAKRAAGANPVYARLVKRHSTVVEKRPSVTIEGA